MKFAPFLAVALLVFSACAPKAVLVEKADQPAATVAKTKPREATDPSELPNFKPDDGLLDPSGLSAMPTDRDMKPTVGPLYGSQSPVIANPPDKDGPTSE